jgi:cytochrome b6-f complex iron-sulfur subunit
MKRRQFLKTACVASTCLLPACKSTIEYAPSKLKNHALVVALTLFNKKNSITVRHHEKSIGIVRINESNYVASLMTCTHKGCDISHSNNGYICPCHGARFSHMGEVIKGPAEKNLARYHTTSDDKYVYVHITKIR